MRHSLVIVGLLFFMPGSFVVTRPSKTNTNYALQDSTLKQRFIVSLLDEYEQKGRWVFVKIERCNNKSAYEIVEPSSIFKGLSETNNNLNKKLFIGITIENLYIHNKIFSCFKEIQLYYPKASYEVEGRMVDMKKYNLLKKFSIKKILNTYFDTRKNLKKQFKKNLKELIAVCYINNVKVITSENGKAAYEVFK